MENKTNQTAQHIWNHLDNGSTNNDMIGSKSWGMSMSRSQANSRQSYKPVYSMNRETGRTTRRVPSSLMSNGMLRGGAVSLETANRMLHDSPAKSDAFGEAQALYNQTRGRDAGCGCGFPEDQMVKKNRNTSVTTSINTSETLMENGDVEVTTYKTQNISEMSSDRIPAAEVNAEEENNGLEGMESMLS